MTASAQRGPLAVGLVLFALLRTGVADGAESVPAASTNVSVIPFEFRRGHAMIPVRVAGKNAQSFILDTGYAMTMLPPGLGEALQLRRAGRVTIVGIAGEEEAGVFEGPRFDLGRLTWNTRRVASFPSSEGGRGRSREGILGSGFFRRFVVEINQRAKTITLREPESFRYSGRSEALPIRFKRGGSTPIVAASLDEKIQGEFEIDTGCDSCLCLAHDFSEKHELVPADSKSGSRSGVGGGTRTRAGRLRSLALGSARVDRPPADFFMEGSPAGAGLAGHIGLEAFREFNLILDYSRQQMILEPLPSPSTGR